MIRTLTRTVSRNSTTQRDVTARGVAGTHPTRITCYLRTSGNEW